MKILKSVPTDRRVYAQAAYVNTAQAAYVNTAHHEYFESIWNAHASICCLLLLAGNSVNVALNHAGVPRIQHTAVHPHCPSNRELLRAALGDSCAWIATDVQRSRQSHELCARLAGPVRGRARMHGCVCHPLPCDCRG